MSDKTKARFRGLHSYYEPTIDTHFVYVYDKVTKSVKVSLKITGDQIQIISGKLTK
jgi:hypothetical protein